MSYLMVTRFNNVFTSPGEIQTYYPIGFIRPPLTINDIQNNVRTIFINLNSQIVFEGTYIRTINNNGNNITFLVRLDRELEYKPDYNFINIGWHSLSDAEYQAYLPIEQENEFYFNLPQIVELTVSQQAALNEINAIALSGGPGTGKSVVSLWRHIRNYETNIRQSLLLTYTKPLAFFLKYSCPDNPNIRNNVNTAWRWLFNAGNHRFDAGNQIFDEIIVDEAQDLGQGQMGDIFFDEIINYTNMLSYGADDSQMLFPPPQGISENNLRTRFPDNVLHALSENFRNTLEIMLFARDLFPNSNIPNTMIQLLRQNNRRGPKPLLQICNNQEEQKQACINIIREFTTNVHNIAILLPRVELVNSFHEYITQYYPGATEYVSDDEHCHIRNIHVATFWGAKGLEFDTVILPNFEQFEESKIYYVGITRAKSNLYLLSNTNNLQNRNNNNTFDVEYFGQNNNVNDNLPF